MPSINIDLNFFEHRKVKRLIAVLGRDSEVLLFRCWCYCGKHHPETGTFAGYSAQEVEAIAGWRGEKGKMVEAMIEKGWMEVVEGGYHCHDWEKYQGHLIAYKKRAEAAAKARWKEVNSGVDASSIASSNAPSNAISNALTMQGNTEHINTKEKTASSPPEKPPKRFVKPTPAEVEAYGQEIGFTVNGQTFVDHYAATGWKRGRTPISDWKACLRTWKANQSRTVPTQSRPPPMTRDDLAAMTGASPA